MKSFAVRINNYFFADNETTGFRQLKIHYYGIFSVAEFRKYRPVCLAAGGY
jgi:hypothetical protein